MPTTPLLGITELSPNQTGKETTINDAILALEAAGNAALPVDMSTGDVTLSVSQFTGAFIFVAGGQTAARTLNIPAQVNGSNTQRVFCVRNDSPTYDVTIQVTGGAGDKVVVTADKSVLVTADGAGNVAKLQTVNDLQYYRFGGFAVADITASEILLDHVVIRDFLFEANFAGCSASAETPPAANFILSIQKNDVEIGTLTINTAGAVTYATTGGAPVSVVAGDVISVVAPAATDALIARLRFTFEGII